jgi:hypothetical protein
MTYRHPASGYDPLYGDTPISELNMTVHSKAFLEARRHLFHVHGVSRERLREHRALVVLGWHLEAHGLSRNTPISRSAMPWGMESVVHRLAGERS